MVIRSTPNDHLTPRPHCRMTVPGRGGGVIGGCPTVHARIVFPAGVQVTRRAITSTPDDHLTASPHYSVIVSGRGHVIGASRCPTVHAGIISPACVGRAAGEFAATPDDHLTASPHCRVNVSSIGGVGSARSRPTVQAGIVPPACVHEKWGAVDLPTPYNHFAAGPHCRMIKSTSGRITRTGWCPAIRARIVLPAGV